MCKFEADFQTPVRQTSHLEKLHLKALNSLVKEDMKTSVKLYDEILFDYPKDIFALNMSYFTSLYIGQRDLCRNIAGRAASAYKKSDRFYGSVHGKLCFGYEEMNQFAEAEEAGRKALEHTPNDIWTIHSIAHLKEETQKCNEGFKFLENTQESWIGRNSLVHHVQWHQSLFAYQLGHFEQSLTILEDSILPACRKTKKSLAFADATALLLRLEMEDVQGLDLQDHWREVGNMYSEIIDETSTFRLFFDFHALLGCLFGDQKSSATKLLDSLTAFTEDCDKAYPENSQGQILRGYGLDLFHGLKAFAEENYEDAFRILKPQRHEWMKSLTGSRAQLDILNQVLITCAVRAKNKAWATQLLNERLSTCGLISDNNEEPSLNQRLQIKIQAMI